MAGPLAEDPTPAPLPAPRYRSEEDLGARRTSARAWLAGHDVQPPSLDDVVSSHLSSGSGRGSPRVASQPTLAGRVEQPFPLRSPYTGQVEHSARGGVPDHRHMPITG